ncbi:MAG: formylglycine-generating enzyme family protein [Magnetococcales bacterium]|nr:formylglycine-generating enzyme family protein [Magnetococcales bacterium]
MRKTSLLLLASFCMVVTFGSAQAGSKEYTNAIGMTFVQIPMGSFTMGVDLNFEKGEADETPQHNVTITQPFYMGKYEVTQQQWIAVMGDNPSKYKGKDRPVEQVNWRDVKKFIRKLNKSEGGKRYRLPTEAEWEYACRAGSTTTYSFGDSPRKIGEYAWFDDNSDDETHPVGQKKPNAWGLYDMHGNVWEWVADWYDKSFYASSPREDPEGPEDGNSRVARGGGFDHSEQYLRSAERGVWFQDDRRFRLGFRLVRD